MVTSDEYALVLWGKGFDETTATIFITEFRRAGLRVRLVGLAQRHLRGAFGLTLKPDTTLEQLLPLTGRISCLVVPYSSLGTNWLRNDPRLETLFERVRANNGKFVIGRSDDTDINLLPSGIDEIVIDSADEDLIKIARSLAQSLANPD